ncbi:uncharacterized protein [Triticum aestivum]|uniref:uncharacterized protein n=1 Tax=Triticum aestivum TaxID=4565 RepID=UPI001D01D31A|nr:uncharacterized protein LOC123105646 [Triticum aestivum]
MPSPPGHLTRDWFSSDRIKSINYGTDFCVHFLCICEGKQAWIHWMMYTHQVHLAFIIASNLILSLLAWWRGRQHGDGGSPRSHPLVSRGEQQAATAPCAHVRGPAEVKPTVAPETLARIHGAA